MAATTLDKVCAYCTADFSVDTAKRAWWSKKFCKDSCRESYHNRIRCYRAKTGTKSDRTVKPRPTAEQRQANEILRIQKSAESRRGMKRTDEQKAKIAAGTSRAWKEGKLKGRNHSEETRAKLSASVIRAYQEGRAKPTGHRGGKEFFYEGKNGHIRMRSKSEVLFAEQLDASNVDWEYEPKMFDLGWGTYTPDFYLSTFNRWIEVKGFWTERSYKKFTEFSEMHTASAVMARDILRFDEQGEAR